MQSLFSQQEANHVISKLHPTSPDEIGTSKWLKQHQDLEAIVYQANCEVLHGQVESTKDMLIFHDKLSFIVADLLVSEAWGQHCMPLLQDKIAQCSDSVLSYSVISHEAMGASLLQTVLHHKAAAEALSEEAALELCDWCTRKLSIFYDEIRKDGVKKSYKKSSPCSTSTAKEIFLSCSAEEEFHLRITELNISAAFSALSILQYLVSHSSSLSLSILHRILCINNAMVTTIHLLRTCPWERIKDGNTIERWENGSWISLDTPAAAQQTICALEAQTWMLLTNLLMDPLAVSKVDFSDEALVNDLMQLQKQILPRKCGQLPFLEDVQRFLDTLTLGMPHAATRDQRSYDIASTVGKVMIEHAPKLRKTLLSGIDWNLLVEKQKKGVFCMEIKDKEKYSMQFLQNVEFLYENINKAPNEKHIQSPDESVKIDVFTSSPSQLHDIEGWMWHGSYRFEINKDAPEESISIPVKIDIKSRNMIREALYKDISELAQEPEMVRGKRVRLSRMLRSTGICAFPSQGKMVFDFNGCTLETLFTLPSNGVR